MPEHMIPETPRCRADRFRVVAANDEQLQNLELYASSDPHWGPDLVERSMHCGYEMALRDLASSGRPLAEYVADFAAARGVDLEIPWAEVTQIERVDVRYASTDRAALMQRDWMAQPDQEAEREDVIDEDEDESVEAA